MADSVNICEQKVLYDHCKRAGTDLLSTRMGDAWDNLCKNQMQTQYIEYFYRSTDGVLSIVPLFCIASRAISIRTSFYAAKNSLLYLNHRYKKSKVSIMYSKACIKNFAICNLNKSNNLYHFCLFGVILFSSS